MAATALKKIALLVIVLIVVSVPAASTAPQEAGAASRPNVILIMTDDQDLESISRMPKLQERLVDLGTSFSHAYATTPRCCPSRATFLRGQYAHNHEVFHNLAPTGGWEKFRRSGLENNTLATWLNAAGYTTGYIGKYLNGYGAGRPTTYVPPGWDRWNAYQGTYGGNSYRINDKGTIRTYDRRELHDTDYFSQEAEGFIRGNRGGPRPWFLVVAPNAPHSPSFAAKRHQDMFRNTDMPRPPSFNEKDVSDKPRWVKTKRRLKPSEAKSVQETWRERQRALQSVDDLVGNVVTTLQDTRQINETYIVYTSDNGYMLFRHRVKAKGAPYEESIGLPFVVRGPGVPSGETRGQLVGNIDFAPTVAEWTGVRTPEFVDGRSLDPLLSSNPPGSWRRQLLLEIWLSHPFKGLRTSDGTAYFEYENGDRELYNTQADPYQLRSLHRSPGRREIMDELHDRLQRLKRCSGGASCRAAENWPNE